MENIQAIVSLFFAISLLYFFFNLYLLSHSEPPKHSLSELPNISILVAFRNEEQNLLACCRALDNLDYPNEKLEILLINDQSEDNSRQIVSEFISGKSQFKLVDIIEEKYNLAGKINALAQAIQQTSNEYIFVTDADCQPQPGWIKTLLQYYTESTGLISGFTILEKPQPSYLDRLQKRDMIFLQGLAHITSNAHRPVTVLGNNFTFRRSVYDRVGGFEKIGFSITEDHALMKKILDETDFRVLYIRDKDGPVISAPEVTFDQFLNQRIRWMIGGLKARPFAFFLVGLSFIVHSWMTIMVITNHLDIFTATAIGLILGLDYFMLKKSVRHFRFRLTPFQFLQFEMFYIIYTHILILILPFKRNIQWKGRKFSRRKKGS